MENGKIYKYTNLVNGMVYIGQTKQTLEQRDYKHQTQLNDNTYFHRAIKKYGRENFVLELVEDNISFNKLNEKEKYYIDYFESFYTTGKGYNLTQGGQWSSGTQKLTLQQVKEIKWLLANTDLSFHTIGNDYNITLYCISDINRGKTFIDESISYPIRNSPLRSYLDETKINIILDMILNTSMTQEEIGLATDVHPYTVGEINRGTNSWCPKDLKYPLRKPVQKNTYKNKITQKEVQEICYKLCFTNIKIEDISREYGIAKNTVGDISRGLTWKSIAQQFQCPIRKHKLKNQKIYESIYGIV
jgi:group I intron endonuclease